MLKNKYSAFILSTAILGFGLFACTDELTLDKDKGNGFVDIQPSKLRATIYFQDYEDQGAVKTRFTTDTTDHWSIGGTNVTFGEKDTVGIFARWGNMNLPTSDGRGGPLINVPMYFVGQTYPKDPNKPEGEKITAYTLENDTVEVYPPGMKIGSGIFMYYPYTPDIGNIENYPNWREYVDVQDAQTGSMYWDTGYSNSPSAQLPNIKGQAGEMFPAIPGLELRVKAEDGSVRCRDVVEMFSATTSELAKGIISGAVYHGFSEIIITRGEGFDKPIRKTENGDTVEDYTIAVVLDRPLSHLRVITYSNWVNWTTQLFYDPDYTFNGVPMDSIEAKKWYAWEGAKYPYTKNMDQSLRKRAWYAIVPSVYNQNSSSSWKGHSNRLYDSQYSARPQVSEIQLYDNEGYLQHITSFTLKTSDTASPTKAPYPYYRWPIQVEMSELGPTVRPVTIDFWDENRPDKDITDVRTAGIHNLQEYTDWASLYNSFISGGRRNPAGLEAYGDLIDNVWHFYVSAIDFEGQTIPVVDDMQDILEGENQFFNVIWSNLNLATPLFSKITFHGGIRNLDFDHPVLIYKTTESVDPEPEQPEQPGNPGDNGDPDDNGGDTGNSGDNGDDNGDTDEPGEPEPPQQPEVEPVGLFAKSINLDYATGSTEVTFNNCNVYGGRVISDGPVGLLAGSIYFGRIADCDFSGDITGKSTSQNPGKLFGIDPAIQLNISNTTTKVMFGQR